MGGGARQLRVSAGTQPGGIGGVESGTAECCQLGNGSLFYAEKPMIASIGSCHNHFEIAAGGLSATAR